MHVGVHILAKTIHSTKNVQVVLRFLSIVKGITIFKTTIWGDTVLIICHFVLSPFLKSMTVFPDFLQKNIAAKLQQPKSCKKYSTK